VLYFAVFLLACRWKSRLGHLSQYFHAYRIDHILGFCRIWEIPGDCATGAGLSYSKICYMAASHSYSLLKGL
jgi:4-alpha-glucanotransferase